MIRAVLFDLGGTLYDYRAFDRANRESLLELAGWAGIEASPDEILRAYRESLRRVFNTYLPRRYYLHRDLFRDALAGTLERFGVTLDEPLHARHESSLRERQQRDFVLREGVRETLDALRARGLGLGIVSNIDEDQLEHLARAGELGSHFDWMLSSEAARSCKPDPAIFTLALERAACAPQEALFVGDTLRQDIAGARRAGLRSVLLWHRDDREPDADSEPADHVIRTIPDLLALIDGGAW